MISTNIRTRKSKVQVINFFQKTIELIGFSNKILKKWTQFQFKGTIALENFGSKWKVDHNVPYSVFNLLEEKNGKVILSDQFKTHAINRQKFNEN